MSACLTLATRSTAQVNHDDFKFPKDADYPVVIKEAANATDFVPKGWKVLGKARGDLNDDKLADAVLVVQGNLPKWKQRVDGLASSPFDTNPRLLLILFAKAGAKGFELAKTTSNIIGCADSPSMDEPFDEVRIKNGVLEIQMHVFMNAGGWSTSQTAYKFQFRGGKFVLIGAERSETERNTGEAKDYSYNFLTAKLSVKKGTIQDDKLKTSTWKSIPRGHLRGLDQFKELYQWEVVKDCYL